MTSTEFIERLKQVAAEQAEKKAAERKAALEKFKASPLYERLKVLREQPNKN